MKPFTVKAVLTYRTAWSGLLLATLFCSPHAIAQGSGRLYDPEPPVDSGYVRVVVAQEGTAVDLAVDGQLRVKKLPTMQASEYLVVGEGKHTITVTSTSKGDSPVSKTFTMERGKAMTLAFPSLRTDISPLVFEDKGNTNKLKATLTAYHLDAKAGAIDILAATGSTKVFSAMSYGKSTSIQVNPISVELLASPIDGKSTSVKFPLEMTQGGTYSILLLQGNNGKLVAKVIQSKNERYVGSTNH